MSKTPYEIRLELLAMAHALLTDNADRERERLFQDWQAERDATGHKVVKPYPKLPQITQWDIIAVAKHLNEFVSTDKYQDK